MNFTALCFYTDFGRLFQLERDENTALRHLVVILKASGVFWASLQGFDFNAHLFPTIARAISAYRSPALPAWDGIPKGDPVFLLSGNAQ